jgi:hypothetical protein
MAPVKKNTIKKQTKSTHKKLVERIGGFKSRTPRHLNLERLYHHHFTGGDLDEWKV